MRAYRPVWISEDVCRIGNEDYGYYFCSIDISHEMKEKLSDNQISGIIEKISELISEKILQIEVMDK